MTEAAPAYEADDTVTQMLCLRNDELQAEKDALATQVDRLEEELAEAKRSYTVLKDIFDNQVQRAVKRARKDWAEQGSLWLKAKWQAEALSETADIFRKGPVHSQFILEHIEREATRLRRQAEGDK